MDPARKAGRGHDDDAEARDEAWRALRRYQDRDLYLTPLATAGEEDGQDLLAPPAVTLATAATTPDAAGVAAYLARSCDVTMRGGAAAALTYPLAACALAEHYLLRRVGGAGVAALTATAVAAAELGRTAPPLPDEAGGLVGPGYGGLAGAVAWLAAPGADHPARLVQPSAPLRAPFRLLVALSRGRRRGPAVAAALAGVPGRGARVAVTLVWLGVLAGCAGFVAVLLRSAAAPWVVTVVAVALVATVILAGAAAHLAGAVLGLSGLLRERAEAEHYGLVPGVPLVDPGPPPGRASELLDRVAGVPRAGGVPPLVTWLAEVVDDLAAVPQQGPGLLDEAGLGESPTQQSRRALTFGDLWLRRTTRVRGDRDLLERAAADPELRAVDLRLVTTDVTTGRPLELPLGLTGWSFCPACLAGVLPTRVVEQLQAAAPRADGAACPRHGVPLRPLPPPAQVPIVLAARLAAAVPGLLRATPLYRAAAPEAVAEVRDPFGGWRGRPAAASPDGVATHWFCDAGAGDAAVRMFDVPLPRWPTVGLAVVPVAADDAADGAWVEVAENGTAPGPSLVAPPVGAWGFVRAVLGARAGWRDRVELARPGARGRLGVVRMGVTRGGLVPDAGGVLRLALRGHHAGRELRARFTGRDGDIGAQTGTDRYRWIRLRSVLREYRQLSLSVSARLPLFTDLAASYRVPAPVAEWFTPPVRSGRVDPAWADAVAALTHLRALTDDGVLDWDTDYGAPPS